MALPHHHLPPPQPPPQPPQPQEQQQQQQELIRKYCTMDGQILHPFIYANPNFVSDQSHQAPYTPPFHVVGFAPTPVPAVDTIGNGGNDLQWNHYHSEPTKRKLKEQDFLENNSQISSIDFLQARPVSTGLGLSLDNNKMPPSADSPLLSLIGDDINRELRQQDAEMDRFLKVQGERLRQAILEKVQGSHFQTISLVEERILHKIREKETEVACMNRKNTELEEEVRKLSMEAGAWRQHAANNEGIIAALRLDLQQAYVQSKESKEGCGDSEVDDTASCCKGRAHLLCKTGDDTKAAPMACKFCRVNQACMLLLPCKHLCLCKVCEGKLSCCPLCDTSKFLGLEIYYM